jgi:hypothetical protein
VSIPLPLAGIDAGYVNAALNVRAGRVVGVDVQVTGERFELSPHGGNHHMLYREFDGSMGWINLPIHCFVPFKNIWIYYHS